MNTSNIKVTELDLLEFNYWIKSKSNLIPQLRDKFKNDKDYEDFMMDAQDKWFKENYQKKSTETFSEGDTDLSIKNDPTIISNQAKVPVPEKQNQTPKANNIIESPKSFIDSNLNNFPELVDIIEKFPEIKILITPNSDNTLGNFDVNVITRNQVGDIEQLGKLINKSREDVVSYVRQLSRVKFIDGTWIVLNDEGHHESSTAVKAALESSPATRSYSDNSTIENYRLERLKDGFKWFSKKFSDDEEH